MLVVKNFDELIHWLVHFRCKLNQCNCSLGMVDRILDVGVFLCHDLDMSSGSGHLPAHSGKDKFQLTEVDVRGFSRRIYWILLYIIDT